MPDRLRRLVCWIRRGHDRSGQPFVLVRNELTDHGTSVIYEWRCRRCSTPRYVIGFDPARSEVVRPP